MGVHRCSTCDPAGFMHNLSRIFKKGSHDEIKNALAISMNIYVQRQANPEAELSESEAITRAAAGRKKQTL
jgi:hypothetical protein